MKTTDNKQNKQLRELSDEELKNVTGGRGIVTPPDGGYKPFLGVCNVSILSICEFKGGTMDSNCNCIL